MANDTPGPDVQGADAQGPDAARPDRSAETTFHPRPTDADAHAPAAAKQEPTARYDPVTGRQAGGHDGPGSTARYGPGTGQYAQYAPGTGQYAQGAGLGTGQHAQGAAQGAGQYAQGAGLGTPGTYGGGPHGGGSHGSDPYGGDPYGGDPYNSATYGSGPYGGGMHGAGTPGGGFQGGGFQGGGAYPPPVGPPHGGAAHPGPAPRDGRRTGRGALVAVGLVAALLGGGVGGAVGSTLTAGGGSGGSAGVLNSPLPAPDTSTTPLGPVEAVAQRVLPSVVRLLVQGPAAAGEGSGMVLSGDGLILTNNHVVEAATAGSAILAVFQDGTTAPADVVGLDPSSDLAVIRARGVTGLTPIEFGDSDAVRVGQQVVAFGSPLGLGGTVTTGIVSAVDRAVSVGEESGASEATVLSALQTDAAINPGNSGGPLTDLQGRVVGINSVIATTGAAGGSIGVGFAIPVNQARRTAQELETTGRATRAILGAGVNAGAAQELDGAVLNSIVPGGPAEQAGIRQGQVVTRVGDRVVTNGNDLIAAIRENAPGDEVTLVVDGQPVGVTLGGETG